MLRLAQCAAELSHAAAASTERAGAGAEHAPVTRRRASALREARPACATSTSRCTCRCATRTRPASCRSPTLRDGETAQVEGVGHATAQVAVPPAPPARRAARTTAATTWCCASSTSIRRSRRRWPSARACACAARCAAASSAGDGAPGVQGRRRRHAAADRADAGLPDQRAAAAGRTCARRSPSALARADLDEIAAAGAAAAGPAEPARGAALPAPAGARTSTLATLEDRSHPAWQRLKFDELLAQQLSQLQAQRERDAQRAPALARRARRPARAAARRAAVRADRARSAASATRSPPTWRARMPMHRLLQGDVGSGKTVVAALAAAHRDRRRLAVRADGADRDPGRAALPQAGRLAGAARHHGRLADRQPQGQGAHDDARSRWPRARPALVVGTHAVIQDQVQFARLGLAIVDEQHRFGVAQRLALRAKLQMPAGARAAPADDERDADPAHAGDDATSPTSTSARSTSCRPAARRSSPSSSPTAGATR